MGVSGAATSLSSAATDGALLMETTAKFTTRFTSPLNSKHQ